jgi:hypothetical protein
MLKKILLAVLCVPLLAFGQSYPSPTFNNLTVNGTFTATGNVGLASLAAQAANTVVGNATASSASPTAITVTGCNGAAQALQWTNGTGFGCNSSIATSGANANITSLSGLSTSLSIAQGGTGRATLTSHGVLVGEGASAINQTAAGTTGQVLIGSTGADPAFGTSVAGLTFTSSITPQSTGGIVGTTAADNANAGSVGEYITATGTAVSLSSSAAANITSISLTAGDWDVWGASEFDAAGSTVISQTVSGISTTSLTFPAEPFKAITNYTTIAGNLIAGPVPMQRISIPSTTTVYLICQSTFGTSTLTATGVIQARRRR